MKITKQELHQIITEELTNALVSLREQQISSQVDWEKVKLHYMSHLQNALGSKQAAEEALDANIKDAQEHPSGHEAGLEELRANFKQTYGFDIK